MKTLLYAGIYFTFLFLVLAFNYGAHIKDEDD